MPYRTAPEKPMKITIELTKKELQEAIQNYCSNIKGMNIPVDLTEFEHTVYQTNTVGIKGNKFTFKKPRK